MAVTDCVCSDLATATYAFRSGLSQRMQNNWRRVHASGTFSRNLSAAVCGNYTSPPMGQLFEARRAEF